MKRKNILIFIILSILYCSYINAQLSKAININTPDTLENLLGSDLATTIHLNISGKINDTDFLSIKKMTTLKELDFSNDNATNNVLLVQSFHRSKIKILTLPSFLTVIGNNVFSYSNITEPDLTRCPNLLTIDNNAFSNTKLTALYPSKCLVLEELSVSILADDFGRLKESFYYENNDPGKKRIVQTYEYHHQNQ